MLQIQQDLLSALRDELDKLSPGAGDKAAFESPKVAAHGDYAVTAAIVGALLSAAYPARRASQLHQAEALRT